MTTITVILVVFTLIDPGGERRLWGSIIRLALRASSRIRARPVFRGVYLVNFELGVPLWISGDYNLGRYDHSVFPAIQL